MKLFTYLTLMIASLAFGAESSAPEVRLRSVTVFAFGGIGVAGITSPGEMALRELMETKDAAVRFHAVFADATAEAKCYVLVALREIDSKLFAECAAQFRSALPEQVRTMEGCLASSISGREMLRAIEAGRYRDGLRKKRPNPPSATMSTKQG